MYRNVDTRGLSDAELQAARHDIVAAVTARSPSVASTSRCSATSPEVCRAPACCSTPPRRHVPAERAQPTEASHSGAPSVPDSEQARVVWAHVDGDRWRSCWPECQRVHVLWREHALSIPGADLARRIADRRAYRAALENYAAALMGLLTELAASMWSGYAPVAPPAEAGPSGAPERARVPHGAFAAAR